MKKERPIPMLHLQVYVAANVTKLLQLKFVSQCASDLHAYGFICRSQKNVIHIEKYEELLRLVTEKAWVGETGLEAESHKFINQLLPPERW